MLGSTSPITRPRPPSQTRRTTGMPGPASPARLRTQSHTPARTRSTVLSPTDAEAPPPPYSEEKETVRPNPRHSLTEIDDMLNVAGSVVRNRERELDAAALASRSLLEENKLMFAKREALLARLPISPRTSLSSSNPHPADRLPTNRSSSWSTCSDDSDMDTGTPRRDVSTPTPADPLEPHRIITPTHSAKASLDLGSSPPQPPAARLVPTQAERIAALHAGLSSPPPHRPSSSTPRRVSVSPAAVTHLQEANTALLARVQELEEATAKAQSEGATRMRRLQAEAESLRSRLGEAEKANEGLRTEAEREKEKQRVRAKSAGARQHRKQQSIDDKEDVLPPIPTDFAPDATWRPQFRSLRGGVRPAIEPKRAATAATVSRGSVRAPVRAMSSAAAPSSPTRSPTTPVRPARAQSNATPPAPRSQPVSPLKHIPLKPSMLRHQRANSYAGLGKVPSLQNALNGDGARMVSTVLEEMTDVEGGSPKAPLMALTGSPRAVTSPLEIKPSPARLSTGVVAFPSVADEDEGMDMSPMSTRLLAQELVAKINELQATNEEIQQQRDSLKEMLQLAQSEADELKHVCERLEHEVEVERSGSGGGSEGEGRMSSGEGKKRRASRVSDQERGIPGLQLEIPSLGSGDLDEAGWNGSVRGRKRGGAALQELAAELGAELQDDGNVTDLEVRPQVDLASELMASMGADETESKPSSPSIKTTFGSLGLGNPIAPRNRQPSSTSIKPIPASSKRGLGNRGLATRAKTNPRRVRKSLSGVMFTASGKGLPSPVSSPTTAVAESPLTPARSARDDEEFVTPRSEFPTPRTEFPPRNEFVTPSPAVRSEYATPAGSRSEFVTPSQQEVYLTPASTLRMPGSLGRAFAPSPVTDDEDGLTPTSPQPNGDSTMAQLKAALDPLFNGVVQGHVGTGSDSKPSPAIQRKRSNMRLVFSKDEPLEPWEAKIRDLYSEIRALELDDPGMSSAGEDGVRGSRRARALGRMSLRRRVAGVDHDASDYAADDSEVGEAIVRRRAEEAEKKRAAGFEIAKKLQQKSMSTFLEVLLLVQFAVVLVVFVYTAVRRGPKAVLGTKQVRR